jgi:sensor histidine kinase YesM
MWLFYVAIYKYSYHLEYSTALDGPSNGFPYIEFCLYDILTTLYVIPYFWMILPKLLDRKSYGWLIPLTIVYFIVGATISKMTVAWVFLLFTEPKISHQYFNFYVHHLGVGWNLILTDLLAFSCIALSRVSYENIQKRHQVEKDHLHLQLNELKSQLQPHFLFNTLNSLYGMSLTGGKDTPRYILLLSQMMQYILYDCDKEEADLLDEVVFLKGYFELEQKKFPDASITFSVAESLPPTKIPPLLFLPLVENSFKHGRHKLENEAVVRAKLYVKDQQLVFSIENDAFPGESVQNKKGGIGLANIKKRLELYYPKMSELILTNKGNRFVAELTLKLK